MRIITKPTVTLVAKPQFIPNPNKPIPPDGSEAVKLGSYCAKSCYDSFSATGRANTANQRVILESAHGSVLEHMHYSFYIEGVTRGLSLELNRHRTFNISQKSTRYTAEEDAAIVLEPYYTYLYNKWVPVQSEFPRDGWLYTEGERETDADDMEINTILGFLNSSTRSIDEYKCQVDTLIHLNPLSLSGTDLRKWARGKARNLLPHCLETSGTWTNNIRGIRWFIESRSSKFAEPEIRVLANSVLAIMQVEAPEYFDDFSILEVYDGIPEWVPQFHKV